MNRLPTLAAIVLAAAAGIAAADGPSQTVLLRAGGGLEAVSEAGEDAEVASLLLGSAAWGFRSPVGDSGFAALSAGADAILEDLSSFETRGFVTLESRLEAGAGELDGLLGLRGSFFAEDPYGTASGRFGYRFDGAGVRPGAWLVGSLNVDPDGSDDTVGGGLRVGLLDDRSVRLGFDASLGGLVESWHETDVYDASGAPGGDSRLDLVTDLQVKVGGLAGYFVEWDAGAQGAARFSTANRLLVSGSLDSDSESRIGATLWAALTWTPERRLAIELALSGAQTWYLGRAALDEAGAATGDALRTFGVAGSLRIDWLVGGGTYLVLEAEAAGLFANDEAEESWSAVARAGIEIAL
jgi:hypothetical protein